MECYVFLFWSGLFWFFKPDTPQCNRLSLGAVCGLGGSRMLCIKLNPHWHSTVLLPVVLIKSLYALLKTPEWGSRLVSAANNAEQGFKGWERRERSECISPRFCLLFRCTRVLVIIILQWILVFLDQIQTLLMTKFKLSVVLSNDPIRKIN